VLSAASDIPDAFIKRQPSQLDVIERDISLHGDLSDQQRERLLQIADKCPVHKTLTGQLDITTNAV